MPPSQLKQLKASLRKSGVYGPQKSKKERREGSKDAADRIKHNADLQQIRDRFNPFEVKTTKKDKFEVVSTRKSKDALGRPGVTKGFGEDRRKVTLLREIQRRNKIGGVVDRRFGEHDPSMTPEQRAAERYARQNLKKSQKNDIFNLEDEEGGGVELTHAGRALSFGDEDEAEADDFDEVLDALSDASSNEDEADIDDRPRKRPRLDNEKLNGEEEGPESDRRKTRKEVMEEVVAKSKLHRYERQKAKEDDDDLRATLDKGMSGVYAALRGHTTPNQKSSEHQIQEVSNSEPIMNPERAAMLAGKDPAIVEKEYIEKEYERRVHEMFEDRRARPSERTRTEEEKAAREAERLHELEAKRVRRMMGDVESSDEAEEEEPVNGDEDDYRDDAEAFGLSQKVTNGSQPPIDVEDEDEFVLDEDLIASDSGADAANEQQDIDDDESFAEDDGDDELINGLRMPDPKDSGRGINDKSSSKSASTPYAYSCPQSHAEFLQILNGEDVNQTPIIIQRIRALYHPSLSPDNKEKLANFADVLVAHIAHLGQAKDTPFSVIENVIRHVHSMAKSMPEAVGLAFRSALRGLAEERDSAFNAGDVVLFTAIATIFPTSDHFHAVVTPAMLIIARYLGQAATTSVVEMVIGMYCCTLALQYQQRSNRYVPEVVRYLCKVLSALLPSASGKATQDPHWLMSLGQTSKPIQLPTADESNLRLSLNDIHAPRRDIEQRILHTTLSLLSESATVWKDKTAINEILSLPITQLSGIFLHLDNPLFPPSVLTALRTTQIHLVSIQQTSLSSRLPLTLHHHRPLAIKTSMPKFEETYNPTRHYDPDADRAGLARLKAEHRRERKGAIRELRRDANFVAREQLRDKKEKDEAYDKKFKRLVSEIQGEEGREGKGYEREKEGRRMERKKGRM